MLDSIINQIPFIYQVIAVAVIALSFGSFAGMLVYRIPNEKPILSAKERSVCIKCDKELKWYHNIPMFSYLFLKGKCAFCKESISCHYFLVESLVTLLVTFTFVYFQSGFFDCQLSTYPYVNFVISDSIVHTLSMMFFVYLLVVLGAIDIMTGYLPNKLTYTGMIFAVAISFIDPSISWSESLIGMCVGYGSLWVIAKSFYLLRGIDGMGHGDFKMLAMIGAFLGWQSLVFIPLVASLTGILFAIISLKNNKNKDKNTEFPFGQYLAVAAFIMIFVNSNVVLFYTSF